jgi:hypothetical protein
MNSIAIVGSGFRSIVATIGCLRKGHKVTIFEGSSQFGGFARSLAYKEYLVDKGPQYFDNFTDQDRRLFEDYVGEPLFKDIGFEYAGYLNSKITRGYAIPDLSSLNNIEIQKIFIENVNGLQPNNDISNLDDYFLRREGATYCYHARRFTKKFLQIDAAEIEAGNSKLITYAGRKKLFVDEVSRELKRDSVFDQVIAGPKHLQEDRYNYYPVGGDLNSFFDTLKNSFLRDGVNIVYGAKIKKIDLDNSFIYYGNKSEYFDYFALTCDVRDAEKILGETDHLQKHTKSLPQVFALVEVESTLDLNLHYIMVYDTNLRIARITNFSNYTEKAIGPNGRKLICCEIPLATTEMGLNYRFDEEIICKELTEILKIEPASIASIKFVEVPSTYKIELNGFTEKLIDFEKSIKTGKKAHKVLFPEGALLTRKEAIDSLRAVKCDFFTL